MIKSWKRVLIAVVSLAVIVAGVRTFQAIGGKADDKPLQTSAAHISAEAKASNLAQHDPKPPNSGLRFAPGVSYETLERENARIKAAVAGYMLKPDLSNVANLKMFKPVLGPAHFQAIAQNGFVVTPTDYTQMFDIYEINNYQRPQMFPSFITTDSMLHTYHVFYDYSLREIETTRLFDAAVKLTDGMLAASEQDFANAESSSVRDAARRNVAFFALARKLLKGTPPPQGVQDLAQADLAKVEAHEGRDVSAILDVTIDFSQSVPRGHYTRSEKLKKYFKALMWYGLSPFPIPNPEGYRDSRKKVGRSQTRQALLIVRNLRTVRYKSEPVMKLWDIIYEPTAFYVGTADDYTAYDYAKLSDKIYGRSPSIESFSDEAKIEKFFSEVKKMAGPGIENYGGEDEYAATGRQFRFMGQRFIPDSRVLQELTNPKVSRRYFPAGLDVFAAMGSDRALSHLRKHYEVDSYPSYHAQLARMRSEMKQTSSQTWQSNLYYGWLWSLQSLIKPISEGYPAFMQSDAWLDKSLLTGLGSWTELRHDTILYAKQSVTSECGGAEEGEEVPTPKGYVEPNLEFWTKLKWLNDYTKQGLGSRGLLNEELKDKFERLGDWLDFCRRVTIKELTNRKVTDEEYEQICIYGSALEQLTLSFAGGDTLSDTDKDMAIVADVHTYEGGVLEEGTGRAGAIYVVVPIEGKLYLTRGGVYTHYEFVHEASDRLTDEKWQEMLNTGRTEPMAAWIRSFFRDAEKALPMEFGDDSGDDSGGC